MFLKEYCSQQVWLVWFFYAITISNAMLKLTNLSATHSSNKPMISHIAYTHLTSVLLYCTLLVQLRTSSNMCLRYVNICVLSFLAAFPLCRTKSLLGGIVHGCFHLSDQPLWSKVNKQWCVGVDTDFLSLQIYIASSFI